MIEDGVRLGDEDGFPTCFHLGKIGGGSGRVVLRDVRIGYDGQGNRLLCGSCAFQQTVPIVRRDVDLLLLPVSQLAVNLVVIIQPEQPVWRRVGAHGLSRAGRYAQPRSQQDRFAERRLSFARLEHWSSLHLVKRYLILTTIITPCAGADKTLKMKRPPLSVKLPEMISIQRVSCATVPSR